MLKTFRENFKHLQWILWLVIGIFVVFVFVDWGMGSGTGRGGGETEVAARAGDMKITVADFQREYRDTEDRYRQIYGKNWSPELLKALNLPEQVLNTMIDRRILRQEVARLRLSVADDELSSKILGMRDGKGNLVFVQDGTFVGEQKYRRMLAGAGMTPEAFEAQNRDSILLEKLNRFFTEAVFISDEDVEKDFGTRNVKAKIAYVLKQSATVSAPSVTDAEAEEHFKKNAAVYQQPERRKAKVLLVDTVKLRPQMVVTDKDIANEYNSNLETYRKGEELKARHILYKSDGTPAGDAAAKAKAEAAIAKLKKGTDFAVLAKAESDDPGSKANGGDLGSFGRGRMVKEFEEAAFSAEPLAIVGPVKTSYGSHVIQVLEKSGERVQPLFEVTGTIRGQLQEKRAQEESKRVARDLADRLAKIDKPSDEQLKKLVTPVITMTETEYLGRNDAPQGIGFVPAFGKALFAMKAGEVSDPVTTPRGEAILKLVDIKPPGPPTFAEVKSKVIADLAKKKQEEATVAALTEAMAQDPTLEGMAARLSLKVETPESFGRSTPIQGLGAASALTDAAFAANPGDVRGPIVVPDRGAVVFKLIEKTAFDRTAFEAQKQQIKDSLRTQKAQRLMQAMIQRRRAEMKIVVNRELLTRFAG